MFRRYNFFLTVSLIIIFGFSGTAFAGEMSRTEDFTVTASGIKSIRFKNITFTDLTYKGSPDAETFTIRFERIVKNADEDEFEDMLSRLDLDVTTSDGKVTIDLIHPKATTSGIFNRIFDRKEWRVKLDVTGPVEIDINMDYDFSDIRTSSTSGILRVNTSFSETRINNHTGKLDVDAEFCGFRCEGLVGTFDVDFSFGDIDLRLGNLGGNSRASMSFGSLKLNLPEGTAADFHIDKSFGSANFRTNGSLTYEGHKGSRRVLAGGGPRMDLKVEFGDITVRDDIKPGSESAFQAEVKPEEPEEIPPPPPEPQFEEGVVKSIKIRGTRLLSPEDVKKILDIEEGKTYTREEISGAVHDLNNKHRLIDYANFSIDIEGNLSVRIYEIKPHKRDIDIDGSFSRIGGVGLGPKLTITSVVGPVSEISGGAQYHFANKEWTYNTRIEKHFFKDNRLAVGGTYRLDYESNMDWAIPPRDSHINALMLGLETKNYHQVEGATGYISFSRRKNINIRAEYFEEKFSSVKKHTNWSFFNHRHVKDDNPPLSPVDDGRLVGMRVRIEGFHSTSLTSTGLILEAERAVDSGHNTIGEYTRLFVNAMNTWKLSSENYLKLRFAGGHSKDILPAQRAFNLGGLNTLRGYDYQSIPGGYPFSFQYGGNRMVLCNVEYSLGEESDMRFIVFADAGGVWVKNQDFDIKDIKRDIGIGLSFGGDFFSMGDYSQIFDRDKKDITDGLRINWAVPVGNEPHISKWTVNFVRAF